MHSELLKDILTDEANAILEQREAQKKHDAKVKGEAGLARSFESHPFWQMFKNDLEKQRNIIIETIMTQELSKYHVDKLKIHAQAIKIFMEEPQQYMKNLKAMMLKYTKRV